MNREEIEDQAKRVLASAKDLASRGAEWMEKYKESHSRTPDPDEEPVRDGNRRIYGVAKIAQRDTGFTAFNMFRLMITPLLIRIVWMLGAYVAYPVAMFQILGEMHRSPFISDEAMWKVAGLSLLYLLLFRLILESLMAIFRIHESTTKTTELLARVVQLEERRQSADQEETAG